MALIKVTSVTKQFQRRSKRDGVVEVMGLVPHQQRKEHARNIGVVFGQRTGLWWDVPVIAARWLLGKTVPGDPGYFLSFLAPFVTAVVLGLAALVWQKGIRRYNSTGS